MSSVKSSKPTLHKNSIISSLSVGQIVVVEIAHTYQKDYGWYDYLKKNYIIEKVSRKEIIARSEKYINEMIKITREDLETGRFYLYI